MKFKDFKRKLLAVLILSVAFCIGMNAQKNCQSAACYSWQNTDNLNLGAKLDTIQKTLVTSGSSLRQSTLDSILMASYYSGIGSSQANLISTGNTVLGSINDNTNFLKTYYGNSELDTLRILALTQKNFNDVFLTNNLSSITGSNIEIKNAVQYMQSQLGNASGNNSVFLDNSTGKSVFMNSQYDSYLDNTEPTDTLFTSTSYLTLINDLNTFYAEPRHQYSRVLQESHSNAIVGSTLTFYCVVRYKP